MNTQQTKKNRMYTVIGVALAMFLGALDQTIVSTAMPRIVDQLSGLDRYTWVSTVYLLVSTILVPIYGKLSDLFSRKALQLVTVSVFLLGSFLCGLAGSFGPLPILGDGMSQLIIFRGIQGLGGGGIFALAFIIVSDLYPPRERGKIGGVFGAVFGLSSIVGPLVGGFLTDHAGSWIQGIDGWRWIFYVNLPLGIIALSFIIWKMPNLKPKDASHKLNLLSAALMVATFLPIILALQLDKAAYPWLSPMMLGLLGFGSVMGVLWVIHSLRAEHPVLDLKLFLNKVFLSSNLAAFFFGIAFMPVIIFLPLYMVNVQGVSATQAGASVIPLSMGMVLSAGLSGFLVSKSGKYKGMMILGAGIAVIGALCMTLFLGTTTPLWSVVVIMILVGVGFGPAQSLYSLAVQNSVPQEEVGQATSTNQFTRQIGSTIGAAVMGTIFSAALTVAFGAHMPAGNGMPQAGTNGGGRANPKGIVETRAEIEKGFDGQYAAIETLFSLRGAEAADALALFMADPSVPEAAKAQYRDGTPAMQVEAAFRSFGDSLSKAVIDGNIPAVQTLLARPEAAGMMSEEQKVQIIGLCRAPPEARVAALSGIGQGLDVGRDAAIARVNSELLPRIKSSFADLKVSVADAVVTGIRNSFAEAIHKVWIISIFVMLLMLIVTVMIPNIPLRTKN